MENASNRDLELLIPEIPAVSATHRGIAREDRPVVEKSLSPQIFSFKPLNSNPEKAPTAAVCDDFGVNDTWRRVEIGPGIELHLHATALSGSDIERLRGALLREIGVLRGWFGEGEK